MLKDVRAEAGVLPSGTVAFLFSDIEGSTQRWETHRQAMAAVIERHDAILQQAVDENAGYVFKRMGDANCAVFHTAPHAIAAAVAAQRGLVKEDFSAVDGLKVRMAIHVGHADERGGDYFGPSVNRVARLLAIGYGGQVLVSGAAADLAQGEMPAQTALRDLGLHRLKDLAQPEQVYQLVAPDLPQKFFPLRSLDALPNNLPLQLTSFIGRESEIEHVIELLGAHRLVSLIGTGGVGKTRLGLQVAADLLDRFEDGAWFVELAPLSDGTLILNELAPLLGVQATGERSLLDALLAALRPKHALLVVDNCEHLVDPAAEIIEKILRSCPKVHILATSREALKIPGETVHRVSSLDEEAGIALFAERASAATDSFQLNDANRATVGKICRRLDGIALAIELAAARIRAVDVNELFARLDERFRILTGGSRTALPRQQTMRALIDWSYDLLLQQEQALLRRVAVFNGGWTLEAATAVCTDNELQSWDILDLMTSLVDKSLVTAELNEALISGPKLRYRLLESTRQYAAEKLQGSGERERVRAEHAAYFTSLAEKAEDVWRTTPTKTWLPPLESEIDNFRGALNATLNEKQDVELGGRLAAALWPLWIEVGTRAEGIRYAERALSNADALPPLILARLWFVIAILRQQSWAKAEEAAERSAALFQDLNDMDGVMRARLTKGECLTRLNALDQSNDVLVEVHSYFKSAGEERWANYALSALARNSLWRRDAQLSRDRFAQVLSRAKAQGDERMVSVIMNNLAESEYNVGNVDRAISLGREIMERDRIRHDPDSLCYALTNLSAYLISAGQFDEAHTLAIEGLRKALDLQLDGLIAGAVQHLAAVATNRGDYERAALLLGFTNTIMNEAMPRESTEQKEYDRVVPQLIRALGERPFNELLERGGSLSQEQAAAEAFTV